MDAPAGRGGHPRRAAAAAGVAETYAPHGGAAGRRLAQDTPRRASRSESANGVPVNLIWTREWRPAARPYRPASLVRLKAGLDDAGNPVALQCRVAAPALKDVDATAALADQPYSIAHLRIEHAVRSSAVPVGYWRGDAHSQNPFVRECFIDELAHAAQAIRSTTAWASPRKREGARRPRSGRQGGRLANPAAARPASRPRRDRSARQLYRRDSRAYAEREEDRAEAARDRARPRLDGQSGQRRRPGPGGRRLRVERAILGRDHVQGGRAEQSSWRLPPADPRRDAAGRGAARAFGRLLGRRRRSGWRGGRPAVANALLSQAGTHPLPPLKSRIRSS